MKDTTESQCTKILNYLYGTFNKLNAKQALRKFGTMKLSTRIGEIEKDYHIKIDRERIKGTRYMQYWISNCKKLSL